MVFIIDKARCLQPVRRDFYPRFVRPFATRLVGGNKIKRAEALFIYVCPLGQLPLTNLLLPLTLLKHCCTRCKNSNKFGFNSLAGVFGKRTPHGTNNCSTARGELSACRLRGGRCYVD